MGDVVYSSLVMFSALFAGGLIGLERSHHGRAAGFRTHTLVCLASSLLMQLVDPQWAQIAPANIQIDPTRIAQGIMTGIGFLGAGVIMREKQTIRGLTTAASIWITSAIGIMLGAGYFLIGLIATALTLFTLSLFRWIESKVPTRQFARLRLIFKQHDYLTEADIMEILNQHNVCGDAVNYTLDNTENTLQYELSLRCLDKNAYNKLNQSLLTMKNIRNYSLNLITN